MKIPYFITLIISIITITLCTSCATTRLRPVNDEIPTEYLVAQNTPNPFETVTTIDFSIPQKGDTSVEIYNLTGKKMDTVIHTKINAGNYSVVWDGSKFSSGIYFYVVKSGDFSRTMKMTLKK